MSDGEYAEQMDSGTSEFISPQLKTNVTWSRRVFSARFQLISESCQNTPLSLFILHVGWVRRIVSTQARNLTVGKAAAIDCQWASERER